MDTIQGYFLDGKSSKRSLARLEASTSLPPLLNFIIDNDEGVAEKFSHHVHQVKVHSRLGNTPREISLSDNQVFITDDNDSIDLLISHLGNGNNNSSLHKFENSLPTIAFATILTAVLLWAAVTFGIPSAAKFIAFQLPDFAHKKLGSSLDVLDRAVFEPSQLSEQRQGEIRQLTAPLLAEYRNLEPKLFFRSGMQANAFALPNGEIVLTDDFVELAQSDDELLAVVFHELGHLKGKHITRRVLQDSMVTLLIIVTTGDLDTLDLLVGLPTLILDLSYSKQFESEADDFALLAMHQHGIDVESFAIIMQRLDDFYNETDSKNDDRYPDIKNFLSTHPLSAERVAKAKQFKATHPN